MNTNIHVAALAVAVALSGTAQAALYDRGGGLIYDSDLNVTWLQDANYAKTSGYDADGMMDWSQATTWAANLNYYDSVRNVTYTDWRLPAANPINGSNYRLYGLSNGTSDTGYNISAPGTAYAGSTASELAYMHYQTLGNPGYRTATGALSGCSPSTSPTCLQNGGPFSNLQPKFYWSGATPPIFPSDAIYFGMGDGWQGNTIKTYSGIYAWALRPGDIANLLPVSLISGSYAITQGQNLLLNGVASYDPDYVADSIVQYAWDLNGDATYDVFGATPDVDPTTLAGLGMDAGTYTLALKVTDTHGTYGVSTTSLTIAAVPEPETYAMMLAGLGLVGYAVRRRRLNAFHS